jgi:hypothetical protein
MTKEQEDAFRADRFRNFFQWATGREAPDVRDPYTDLEVERTQKALDAMRLGTPASAGRAPAAGAPEQPTGPLASPPRQALNLDELSKNLHIVPGLPDEQLSEGIKAIARLLAGGGGTLSREQRSRLIKLQSAMEDAYVNPLEKALGEVGDFFITSPAEREDAERKRKQAWTLE